MHKYIKEERLMKKLVSLVLALIMLLSIASIAAADEPATIVVATNFLGNNRPADLANDFVYQTILDRTGVAVDLVYLDDYDTALNARIIGGDVPDMFMVSPEQLQTYAAQDLLLPLTQYKETELKPVFDTYGADTDIPSLYYGDEMYGIPAAKAISDYYMLILVRKDWNEKYNLKTPTTVDELFDYCNWLANNDPDGNNIKDTIAFTGWGLNGLSAITAPYDVVLGNYVIIRDGKTTNSLLRPRMTEALEMAKKFYDNGLLDPDMFTANSAVKANVIACNVGVAAMPWSNILKQAYIDQYKAVNPEAELTWIDALSDGKGGEPCYAIAKHDKYVGDKLVVNADIDDDKLASCFKVMQYLCTEEGVNMLYVGLEGEHWTKDADGKIVANKERASEINYTNMWQWMGRNDALYLELKFPEAAEATAFGLEMPRYEYFNTSVILPEDYNVKDMEDYVNMQMIAFIKGERPIAEYDAFIKELYDSYDFGTYMEICASQLVEQGLANE